MDLQLLRTLSVLSVEAYEGTTALGQRVLPTGWAYARPESLGFTFQRLTLLGSSKIYSRNGMEAEVDGQDYFHFGSNAAYVAVNAESHQIALVFRGTDSIPDILTDISVIVGSFFVVLNSMSVVIDAVGDFAGSHTYAALTAGHSLGGGLAEALASRDLRFAGGLSLGGPGYAPLTPPNANTNADFVHVAHTGDAISNLIAGVHIGLGMHIDSPTFGLDPLAQHSSINYDIDIGWIAGSDAFAGLPVALLHDVFLADRTGPGLGSIPLTVANIVATPNADVVDRSGATTPQHIEGGMGGDVIRGGTSIDILAGGAGADFLLGGFGADTLFGNTGNDRLEGGMGDDLLIGGFGGDEYVVRLGEGHDKISDRGDSTTGSDKLILYGGSIVSSLGRLSYTVSGANLIVQGRDVSGNVVIDVTIENMNSSAGQIEFLQLYGPGGSLIGQVNLVDKWNAPSATPVILSYGRMDGAAEHAYRVAVWGGLVRIEDTPGNDTMVGTDAAERFGGNSGNDTILAGGGNDYLEGGNDNDRLEGGPGDDLLDSGRQADIVLGGTGNDLYLVYDYEDTLIELAGEGYDTVVCVANNYTLPDNFERLVLANSGLPYVGRNGNGNALDNVITGNDFDNIINGFGGNDQLFGDAGDDEIDGGAGDDQISGEGDHDILHAELGNDTVTGGAGNDTIYGGVGNVTTAVYSGAIKDYSSTGGAIGTVTITDSRGGSPDGTDYLTGVERLRFADGDVSMAEFIAITHPVVINGTNGDDVSGPVVAAGTRVIASGNGGNDVLFGAEFGDELSGGDGNDVLVGGVGSDLIDGGAGLNQLQGGEGDDVYIVSNAGDSVIEFAGDGIDEERTALTVLTLAINAENLTFTGSGSFLGLGNASDNIITGGTGRDDLYGRDGNDVLNDGGNNSGNADTLIGGLGNDIYIVGERGSSTIEYAGEGIDEVRTTISIFALQNNVENLTLTDNAVHGAGVGNTLNNVLTGGTGTDDLFGREGNDTLIGGTGAANTLLGQEGDDLYIVAVAGDSVIEFVGEGTDTVQTALLNYTLRDNVEILTFTGSGDFTGVGSVDNNVITAGAGADFLSGLDGNDVLIGGSGGDLMLGGNGADQFRYLGGETGLDRIIDFVSGSDKIALSGTGFVHTATVAFVSSGAPVATTSNSTFLYNVNNGILSYDADGTGAGAAVQLAQLNAGLTLAAGDFIFF
jgi:Ca2+-binding RTX toxin-like protein